MKGRVLLGKRPLPQAWIKIYSDSSSTLVQKVQADNEGYVAFQIPISKFYTLKISKPGFVTKVVTIDANMPKSSQNGDYFFEFSTDLFESIEGLDVALLRQPVAKIFFNTFTKKFDYDFNYTAKINNELKELYSNYKLQKKKGKIQEPNTSVSESENTQEIQPEKVKATEEPIANGPKTTYSVEIISSAEQLQKNDPQFKGIINVNEYQEDNLYKYYIGNYPTQKGAEKMKDNISGYFPKATIISFIDGKKVITESVTAPPEK